MLKLIFLLAFLYFCFKWIVGKIRKMMGYEESRWVREERDDEKEEYVHTGYKQATSWVLLFDRDKREQFHRDWDIEDLIRDVLEQQYAKGVPVEKAANEIEAILIGYDIRDAKTCLRFMMD